MANGGSNVEEQWEPDDDEPDEDYLASDDGEAELVACPACRADIPDSTDRCPYCGEWVVQGGATARPRRAIWVAAAVLIAIALLWIGLSL